MQLELEIAALQLRFGRLIAEHVILTGIPKHHTARAIIAFRYVAFESAVVERMVLYFHGQ